MKKRKETKDKAKAERTTMKQTCGQEEEEERGFDRSQKSPSLETKEEDQQSEQGGTNPGCHSDRSTQAKYPGVIGTDQRGTKQRNIN